MILGGLVGLFLGVPAQQQPLEATARHAALGDGHIGRRLSAKD
jgi:hypothetical protein